MKNLLEGRVAVVTGAGNGIGRAHAMALAAYGAKVVVNDIGTSPDGIGTDNRSADAVVAEIEAAGNTAVANYDSVADEAGAAAIIKTAVDTFGRIDILINNAGVIRDPRPIWEVSTADWEAVIKTHLFGMFFTARAASPYMRDQKWGRIVNTSSHTGFGWEGFADYSAAKEGIAGMTRTLARDMAPYGGTCNAIRPIAHWRGTKGESPVAVHKPEDIAPLIVFLASEQAGNINGRIFEVWKGHVGIFDEPPQVQQVITKDGRWTVEELLEQIPQTLGEGLSANEFAPIMNLG